MKRLTLFASLFLAMIPFLSGASLNVGSPAPLASARTETGAELNLGDVYSQSPYTLVYFYPKADTPGCTKQGCSLRDAYTELTTKGVTIIGVSTDDVADQKAFKEKYNLPFTLLADTEKKVMKAFGQNSIMFASRQAYLIHNGTVVYADHKGSTTQQADDILAFLAKK